MVEVHINELSIQVYTYIPMIQHPIQLRYALGSISIQIVLETFVELKKKSLIQSIKTSSQGQDLIIFLLIKLYIIIDKVDINELPLVIKRSTIILFYSKAI
ncbi:hypothetical protein TTHERM_000624779 (macronuclear) [Tetrahymena thermophila SB210]|uniref:Uncharacterized protein n=1 Tax=Tetrahymena thermophila (strain SB210) TaxID=312017 RepID=W7X8H0_TETTS|nr:hypothetical protein TTHERM_000624779 [Tetrahymena thermophila SB210]EWS72703.1 hypothetical protein TTHERM_000624779 [Tetrahymena thermophila SB210]|eukprot:XP_012654779.1 hypothetical protein TTHERM_000624779 [Tetrahymena thermophila SB210]